MKWIPGKIHRFTPLSTPNHCSRVLIIVSTGVLSFGSFSPNSLSSLSWRVGFVELGCSKMKSPCSLGSIPLAWLHLRSFRAYEDRSSLWIKRSGGFIEVWITLDVDWNVSGEQVQSGKALAHTRHSSPSLGGQMHSGLALAQLWHLSSPVIFIVYTLVPYHSQQIKTPWGSVAIRKYTLLPHKRHFHFGTLDLHLSSRMLPSLNRMLPI